MDSEHRHELARNELADWIWHIPDFIKKHSRTLIGLALIIFAVLFFIYFKFVKNKLDINADVEATNILQQVNAQKQIALQTINQGQQPSSALIKVAADLEQQAKDRQGSAAALAYIKQGNALRADLLLNKQFIEKEVITSQTEKAKKAYQKALEKAKDNTTLTAAAKMGIALCSEDLNQFEEAIKIYKELTTSENFKGTGFVSQAKIRLQGIEDSMNQPYFAIKPAGKKPEPMQDDLINLPSSLEEAAELERSKMQPNTENQSDTNLELDIKLDKDDTKPQQEGSILDLDLQQLEKDEQ
jgi:tetratricopeptide (TPR) repeat protein